MKKVYRIKNKYTGDIFYTYNFEDITEVDGIKFIRVFHENQPERTFLVNRDAFIFLTT
jgi:hypothetical protein